MARPPKDPAEVSSRPVGLRLRPALYDQIKAKADALGMSLSAYFIKAAAEVQLPRPVPEVNRLVARELIRIGTNMNQLAHAANAGTPVGVNPQDLVVLAQIMRRFREDLLGRGGQQLRNQIEEQ